MTFARELDRLALGRAIRRLREAHGLSLEQVAARAEMEAAMVNAIEQGEIDARWSTVMILLRSLDASVTELGSEMG